jgi:hypothetical protein
MRTFRSLRACGLLVGLAASTFVAGCSEDKSNKVVPQNEVTKQKNEDMQKAMMGNMKGPMMPAAKPGPPGASK